MTTAETLVNGRAARVAGESLSDRVLAVVAMGGAVCGAVTGVAFSASLELPPTILGSLGAVFGSLGASLVGHLILPAWAALFRGDESLRT